PWPNSPGRRRRPRPRETRRRPPWRALRARRRPSNPKADGCPRRAVTANAAGATDPRARQGWGLRPTAEGVRPPEWAARRAVVEGGGRGAREAVVAVHRRRGGERQPAAGANVETAVAQRRRPADTARC
ncbi:unnamed protein product, partial [Ectocarpus fasciculatus]